MKLEEIYKLHSDLVYNLALHYSQNVEDAQEITQDVFVAAYQNLDSFRNDSAISTWLYRITINKSLDYLKSKKRKKRFAFISSLFFDDSNDLKHNPAELNHPGIQMEDKEALEELLKQINELPDSQKTALILNKIEQKSLAEIAEIMNISSKAAESLIQRAKTNLSKKVNIERRI
ncbi:MAG: RNA polymerase sigma factor [Saprospiraceae bacterium]|nr:RNA polymerase sigma factor [Saprospiraceae bacterium]